MYIVYVLTYLLTRTEQSCMVRKCSKTCVLYSLIFQYGNTDELKIFLASVHHLFTLNMRYKYQLRTIAKRGNFPHKEKNHIALVVWSTCFWQAPFWVYNVFLHFYFIDYLCWQLNFFYNGNLGIMNTARNRYSPLQVVLRK